MPELPEVQTVVDTLRPRLLRQQILRVHLARRDILHPQTADLADLLTGRTIESIERRAKRIVLTLNNGSRFYIHLGMTGQLTLEHPQEPIKPHTHVLIDLSPSTLQLRFRDVRRFGGIWWLGDNSCETNLGPEPLTIRSTQLAQRLSCTRRAIKCALLDQSVLAGLGNIYVDESLFLAQIHPLVPANSLTPAQVSCLTRAIKRILRRAIRHKGSTLRDYVDANGASGRFQNLHLVYAREAHPCKTCRTPIQRIVLSGRSTHFCPSCQSPMAKPARHG